MTPEFKEADYKEVTKYEPLHPSHRDRATIIEDNPLKDLLDKNLTEAKEFVESELKKHNTTALDTQVGGGHYKEFKIQPIEFVMKNNLNFCQGNVIKYVCRYKDKNGIEDLKKAKHYIDLLIQLEFGNESQGLQAN